MTIQEMTDILKRSGADGWELTQTVSRGWEFYFIRHLTDQNRYKNIESFQVSGSLPTGNTWAARPGRCLPRPMRRKPKRSSGT